jgi:peptidyl-prolyl cis-trans isomerase B (cyclophilin B)
MLLSNNTIKLITAALLLVALSACSNEPTPANSEQTSSTETTIEASPQPSPKPEKTTMNTETKTDEKTNANLITLKTSMGDIELELDSQKAPATVNNFLNYVAQGHYDGTVFHRVIPGFMIQGGGFEPGMQQKQTNAPVLNEANNGLLNDEFTIAMARTGDPHSATAQFFINVNDNASLNFSSETPAGWGYTVFGKVTKGQEVVKQIELVSTGQKGPYGDVPNEDVVIESVSTN